MLMGTQVIPINNQLKFLNYHIKLNKLSLWAQKQWFRNSGDYRKTWKSAYNYSSMKSREKIFNHFYIFIRMETLL